jgi:hypothetical protein
MADLCPLCGKNRDWSVARHLCAGNENACACNEKHQAASRRPLIGKGAMTRPSGFAAIASSARGMMEKSEVSTATSR